MNILLVGSGGREHALAWKIAQSPLVSRLVIAPGNPGMEPLGELRAVKADDVEGLVALAREIGSDLVVVGPEAALAAGLADRLSEAGVPCFGPSAQAARLETSKAFAKAFLERHDIPTAGYGVYETAREAREALSAFKAPYVIKADGLAAGKGVAISPDRKDAEAEIERMLGGRFGQAGARVVIEEFMEGEEGSLFALSDGRQALLLGGAQDHKRAFDGDVGPNTGGMGAYSPAPVFTPELVKRADAQIVQPTIRAMAAEGAPYRGVLYAGLMATEDGPKVVEFNARFGDPECQVLMMRLADDIVPVLLACARGDVSTVPAPGFKPQTAICVVMAAKGYPDSPLEGSIIRGAEQDFGPHVQVFHAGTKRRPDGLLAAAGGRVLNVCALGDDVAQARERAYAAVRQIDWPGGFCRTDIGWRALNRES
ncbi:phosphoribosylamine--glycine ligase [Brevundimonas sp. S30B]|uniref:phosphoribosylamine--glycine ligase n=1 Tax=unclassified Brevundimonas TaxID=2622653 RepID=UPI001072E1C9|nr:MULTISPECIES: phosphoribosylamine--glycine ligase [unclassified Brevundimonas]QBX38142.1 phosphoribosylamine--glycine ligase [Brevundimonas sp. MF30-B]TFW01722.1 phosphoribosylamine--glycine ligase [Brevundimonas sp. S30B]